VINVATLIVSSIITKKWLSQIKSEIEKQIPETKYSESQYWATFGSSELNRNFVYLRPYKTLIQLFTPLPVSYDDSLVDGKTSGGWMEYISLFKIKSEHDIGKAIHLISKSYAFIKASRK